MIQSGPSRKMKPFQGQNRELKKIKTDNAITLHNTSAFNLHHKLRTLV